MFMLRPKDHVNSRMLAGDLESAQALLDAKKDEVKREG